MDWKKGSALLGAAVLVAACQPASRNTVDSVPRSPAASEAAPAVQNEPIGTADGGATSVPQQTPPAAAAPGPRATTAPEPRATTAPGPRDPLAAAPRVTATEARQAVVSGNALLVDVRSEQAYREGHLPGAVSIPLEQLPQRMGELPRDRQIITYCT